MDWLKEQTGNPIFLLAVAVAIIALWLLWQQQGKKNA